jgi:rRNA-processing protein FCF1
MLAYQFKIDIFRELEEILPKHELVISNKILHELKKISKSNKKSKPAARFALKLIESKEIKIVESKMEADRWIFDYARENKSIVCTNDSDLKEKLKMNEIKVIGLKGKTKIDFL